MTNTKAHIWRIGLVGILALCLSLVMGVRLARLQLSAQNISNSDSLSDTLDTTNYTITTQAMR